MYKHIHCKTNNNFFTGYVQEEVYNYSHSTTHWLNHPLDVHWSLHFDVHQIHLMYEDLYKSEISMDNHFLCTSITRDLFHVHEHFFYVHQRTFH